jgi:prepilin-type N-terminal cleavage/methylation domain-containing protein
MLTIKTLPTIKKHQGFTLIEMVIVMIITGIITAASSIMLSAGFKNYFVAISTTGLNTRAGIAMMRMSKELQQAASISNMTATSVTFTTTGGSTITYSWSSPTITRTGVSSQTLNNEVTAFSLSYYQANFTTTATASAVRAITINATFSNTTATLPLINTVYLGDI